MRYFLRLAYNGKDYHGWQIQPNANSIQQELNKALSTLLRKEINVVGAGRTDTGVHAKEMFAHFDWEGEIETENLIYRLNRILPAGIAIYNLFQVQDDDHTRFSAVSRKYEYHLASFKDPFSLGTAYLFHRSLNVELMNAAAQLLIGRKDFECFSKTGTQVHTNICTITLAKWIKKNGRLVFTIEADRFLRNMVRAITGTLLKVGLEEWNEQDILNILESKNRSQAGESVPAHGLYLVEVKYPEHIEQNFERIIQ
ncbi:MAG: tRNA pseudouridine(38-40) synthase TruA [Schleiferiaceae bacterium]|nr:tRNA pseudouridine(38-40) synthase TruA [Schleiferiaceae bacterium]